VDAHGAEADVLATVKVLDAMVLHYDDIPRTISALHEHYTDPSQVDHQGRFRSIDGKVCFAFGKYKNKPLAAIIASDEDYLHWTLNLPDFPEDSKDIIRVALAAVQPAPPKTTTSK
jgi:DNA polymerase-3 subunit epsilon